MGEMIQNNPQAFISLLTQNLNQQGGIMQQQQDESVNESDIQMSEDEKIKVTNLHGMFPTIPKITILETLKACDNDETLAANLLYDF